MVVVPPLVRGVGVRVGVHVGAGAAIGMVNGTLPTESWTLGFPHQLRSQ